MSGADLPSSSRATAGPPIELEPVGALGRLTARFTTAAERFIPDAFVFALLATVVVVVAAMATGSVGPFDVIGIWGKGFWGLLSFTMQMCLVVITGYVLATTRPVHALIAWCASRPRSPRGAVALVALLSMLTSWLNWGFSLMFSAMLALEVARRVRGVDYRAVAASAFMGLGSIWAQGLSGSAALQMATPTALSPAIRAIVAGDGAIAGGIIPFTGTILLWQSLVSCLVEIVVVTALLYAITPPAKHARTALDLGIVLDEPALPDPPPSRERSTLAEWLEHSPLLNVLVVALAGAYLVQLFWKAERPVQAISIDVINLAFLTLGIALHGTPARLMRAVRDAAPATWGIMLQYPFYAGMAALISETKLNERLAHVFVSVSTPTTYPALVAIYSAVLGIFVPSGGSKWIIEAPYVMQAAHEHQVHLGWMVAVYDLGEALANLIQPFWMLPILALFRLRARDVMGYTFLVFVVLTPVVLALVTLLGATLPYPL